MSFERKSMEQITNDMIKWTRGVTTKLTDFRVGSRIRTLYEALAKTLEDYYDNTFRELRKLVEENIYSIIGFNKLPATSANGILRFSRSTPADREYLISAGVTVSTQATEDRPPVQFYTTENALIAIGETFVDVKAVCVDTGEIGNVEAGAIIDFVQKPVGIDAVINPENFVNGTEEETKEEQKQRFQQFIEAQARGVLLSIEYGARNVALKDENGSIVEQVIQAKALEYLPERKGEVDLYIWNGLGDASAELLAEVTKIQHGYYDAEGKAVFGYKPAGILLNVYTANTKYVKIKVEIIPEAWVTMDNLKIRIEDEISRFLRRLGFGQTLIHSALQANIKFIDGIKDVRLTFSTDGTTYTTDNVEASPTEIIVADAPIEYVEE